MLPKKEIRDDIFLDSTAMLPWYTSTATLVFQVERFPAQFERHELQIGRKQQAQNYNDDITLFI
jgi:hypothetical protein